jgi:diguanylate cyclase (GGDEF)-like protein
VSASTEQITNLLKLVQAMTERAIHTETADELVGEALRTLFESVPFDSGAAVLVEQNFDLYVKTRNGVKVTDATIEAARDVLKTLLPQPFATAEVVVRGEAADLPSAVDHGGDGQRTHAILKRENRPIGLLLIARTQPFSQDEMRIVEIFGTHVSMLLDNLVARERIMALAETDDLTGVPNRRFFTRQLANEIERSRVYNIPLSLMMIDIDDFKLINDTYGHVTGDVLLSELCGKIRESLRSPDAVSRYGGDEFTVTLPHTGLNGAVAVAERILEDVRKFTMSGEGGQSIRCTVSVGIAQLRDSDVVPRDFIERADERLYEAKRHGKNRSAF